jgi:hypothetical protein
VVMAGAIRPSKEWSQQNPVLSGVLPEGSVVVFHPLFREDF